MDATRRNLERVLDILSELEPRLRSLERQAKRAMEYDRLRADLRVLLRDWYGYHWNRSQVELVRSREVVKVQEERLNQVRERQTEVEAELSQVRAGLQELRGKLNVWHSQSAGLHTERERVSRALAVMDERQLSLAAQKRSAESDLARLEEEQKARQDRLAELEEERTRLQEEMKEAGERAAQARSAVEKRQAERGQLETRLRETRRALLDAETRQVQGKARVDELTNRLESLRASKHTLEQGAVRDAEDMARAQERLAQWVKNREQAESELNTAEENLRMQRQAVAALEEDRRQAQEMRSRLDAERSRLSAQAEVLEQAERSLSGLATGARYILQEAHQGRLKGGYRALSSVLMVPADLEAAIAAALGEFLDSVLVEKGVDLEDALQSLDKGEQGRAVLLPLNEARKKDVLKVAEDEGCLGVAAELIQAPAELQDAVRLLLGQVLVARDRTSARKLARTLPETARVVTLQGEVFLGNGAVVAGRESKTSSLIGRTRRIQEMHQSLDESAKTLADAQQRLKGLEENLQRQRAKEKELDGLVRQAQSGLSKANQGYQQAVLETEQVKQKQEYQARQLAGLDAQLEKANGEIRQAESALESGALKVRELTEQVRELNRSLSGLPLEELQSELAHWTTSQAVSSRAVREADRRQLEQAESLSVSRRQTETLQQRVEVAAAGLSQLEAERAAAHMEEAQLNQQIEALQIQIDPAEEQLRAVEVEADRVQDNLIAAQQAVSVAERHATQAQLEFGRCRDGLDSLRRKVEEDFGLVAFEYSSDVSGPTPLPLDGMVEQLPSLAELPTDLEDNIARQRALLRRMGPVNPEVQNEYNSVKERFDFLTTQVSDLHKADTDLRQVIAELDELMKREFRKTFDAVAREFHGLFSRLFGGGSAHLVLTDAESTADMGIDIEARLPGRRDQGLSLLSGGERSLTAVALIFSLLKVSPTPFCVMDEVDAMLDEANVGRFRDLLLELAENTQFVLVTHNRNTVQAADVIYGVTMGHDSASQVISLRLDELSEELVK